MTQHQRNSAGLINDLHEMITEQNVDGVSELLKAIDVDSLKASMESISYEARKTGNQKIICMVVRRKNEILFPEPMKIEYEKRPFVPYFLPLSKKTYRYYQPTEVPATDVHVQANEPAEEKAVANEGSSAKNEGKSVELIAAEPKGSFVQRIYSTEEMIFEDKLLEDMRNIFSPDQLQDPVVIAEVFSSTMEQLSIIGDEAIFEINFFRDSLIDEVD